TPGAGAMSTLSRSIETSCARTVSGSSNRRSSRFTVAPLARSGALLRLARLHLARSRSSRASLTRLHTSAHDRLLQIIDLAPVAGVQRLLRLEVPRGAAGRGAQALDRGVDVGEVLVELLAHRRRPLGLLLAGDGAQVVDRRHVAGLGSFDLGERLVEE